MILSMLSAVHITLTELMPQKVFADTTSDGNYEYSVSGDEVTITGHTCSAAKVELVLR